MERITAESAINQSYVTYKVYKQLAFKAAEQPNKIMLKNPTRGTSKRNVSETANSIKTQKLDKKIKAKKIDLWGEFIKKMKAWPLDNIYIS